MNAEAQGQDECRAEHGGPARGDEQAARTEHEQPGGNAQPMGREPVCTQQSRDENADQRAAAVGGEHQAGFAGVDGEGLLQPRHQRPVERLDGAEEGESREAVGREQALVSLHLS